MSESNNSGHLAIIPDALRRPAAAVAIAVAATLITGELTGCGSASEQQAGVSSPSTPIQEGPSVSEVIPSQPKQPPRAEDIWAGYVSQEPSQGKYTYVQGSFTVPQVHCDAPGKSYAQWVGLDGLGNGTVEQIGVTADCIDQNAPKTGNKDGKGEAPYTGPHDYQPYYYAWGMNFGTADYSQTLKLSVRPGDRIDTSVTYAGGDEFDMRLTNETTGQKYEQATTCRVENGGGPCERSMADWIVERAGFAALANFGTATFTSATASTTKEPGKRQSVSELSAFPIDMIQGDNVLATASGLSADGQSFSVFYKQPGQVGQ